MKFIFFITFAYIIAYGDDVWILVVMTTQFNRHFEAWKTLWRCEFSFHAKLLQRRLYPCLWVNFTPCVSRLSSRQMYEFQLQLFLHKNSFATSRVHWCVTMAITEACFHWRRRLRCERRRVLSVINRVVLSQFIV